MNTPVAKPNDELKPAMSKALQAGGVVVGESNRIDGIDLAKGIAMLVVVLSHTNLLHVPLILGGWALPMFFLISGVFYNSDYSFLKYITRNFYRLLCPLLLFMAIGFIVRLITVPEFSVISFLTEIPGSISYGLDEIIIKSNGPLWFIVALFFMEIVWWAIDSYVKNPFLKALTTLLIAAFAVTVSACKHLPLWSAVSFMLLPFYALGSRCFKTVVTYQKRGIIIIIGIIATLTGIYIGYHFHSYFRPFWSEVHGNAILCYISSILMCGGALVVCLAVGRLPILNLIGRNSMAVLCTHLPVIHLTDLFLERESAMFSIVVLLLCLPTSVLVAQFINKRYLPIIKKSLCRI